MSEKKSLSINAVRFVYGDETIVVQCALRQVVKGRILIKVHPDCRVVASVPSGTPEQDVLSALKKRGRWIYQQLRDFRKLSLEQEKKHIKINEKINTLVEIFNKTIAIRQ